MTVHQAIIHMREAAIRAGVAPDDGPDWMRVEVHFPTNQARAKFTAQMNRDLAHLGLADTTVTNPVDPGDLLRVAGVNVRLTVTPPPAKANGRLFESGYRRGVRDRALASLPPWGGWEDWL